MFNSLISEVYQICNLLDCSVIDETHVYQRRVRSAGNITKEEASITERRAGIHSYISESFLQRIIRIQNLHLHLYKIQLTQGKKNWIFATSTFCQFLEQYEVNLHFGDKTSSAMRPVFISTVMSIRIIIRCGVL